MLIELHLIVIVYSNLRYIYIWTFDLYREEYNLWFISIFYIRFAIIRDQTLIIYDPGLLFLRCVT